MPRTTLDIDAVVLGELRRRGGLERKSMSQVASELLARGLAEHPETPAAPPMLWTSRDLGPPRVDLEDREALQGLLDGTS